MPIPIVETTDHAAQAKARLPGWLADAAKLKVFLDVLVGPYQTAESLFIELLNENSIETAVGVQLGVIGAILNLPRIVGEDDTTYRTRLFGQAGSLSQSGEPEVLIQAWLAIWNAASVLLVELQPATIELTAFAADPVNPAFDLAAVNAINKVIAGGVGTILQQCDDPCFLWGAAADANGNGDLSASGTGFGDDADADANGDILPGVGGGNLARILT